MLKHTDGARKVPVIIEGEDITIGFGGKTWGVWLIRLEAELNQRFTVQGSRLRLKGFAAASRVWGSDSCILCLSRCTLDRIPYTLFLDLYAWQCRAISPST
jgi:hypothetical protein